MMIKEKLEWVWILTLALLAILLISILHALGIIKVDDEYGF